MRDNSHGIGWWNLRVAGLMAFWATGAFAADARQWTDLDGRKVEAEYVKVEAGQVHLKLVSGKTIPFPYARLSPADQAFVKKLYGLSPANLANQIDAFVTRKLAAKNTKPNPKTTDEQFVRRVYLEITGTIPTFDQTLDFLESKSPEKRRKLIDSLLETEAYVSHSFNWFADMLRAVSITNDWFIYENYLEWIKQSIRANKPYDKLVYEMLSADGPMRENPAAGYFLRDRGMPLGNLATTATIFLGTEITCAECHDHPFEDWTQMDFYSLAAYLGRTRDQFSDKESQKQLERIESEERAADASLGADGFSIDFRLITNANQLQVWDDPKKQLKLPKTYKYEDGKPDQVVVPSTLFGEKPDLAAFESPRDAYAAWMTSKANPMFTKTAVNRLWKRAFGLALYEPMGNIQDLKNSENPELFTFLEGAFQELNFDLKEFLRSIYYTEAWQRQATLEGPTLSQIGGNEYHFPGPVLKRMTAQQLWDSFLTLTVPDPMRYKREVSQSLADYMTFDLSKVEGEEALKLVAAMSQLRSRTISSGAPSEKVWSAESTAVDPESSRMVKYAGSYLARASEICQPAPNGHFLRAWGQSDRSLVDASSDNGSVPQILTMINGPFTQMLIKPDSLIFKSTGSQRGTGDKMEKIYLSILNRYPQGKEKTICSKAIRSDDEGYGDLIWALVNTREFLFIR